MSADIRKARLECDIPVYGAGFIILQILNMCIYIFLKPYYLTAIASKISLKMGGGRGECRALFPVIKESVGILGLWTSFAYHLSSTAQRMIYDNLNDSFYYNLAMRSLGE